MNPKVDQYFLEGCGRCELYQSPECKVHRWPEQLRALRAILLDTELQEEVKWSVPVYTYNGKNVVILSALKDFVSLSFFKGSLIQDEVGLLHFAGPNSRIAKMLKIKENDSILELELAIRNFIQQAISLEIEGVEVEKSPPQTEPYPDELKDAFAEDLGFEKAFKALTPGRQRGYLKNINGAKQSATRRSRIEKWKPKILLGKGMMDR